MSSRANARDLKISHHHALWNDKYGEGTIVVFIDKPEKIFEGMSLFLADYYPEYFEENSIELKDIVETQEPKNLYLITILLKTKDNDKTELKFLSLLPDRKGVYKYNDDEYFSPLVLVEKRAFIEEGVKESDLDKFWVIPGYFLFKALKIYQNITHGIESLHNGLSTFKIGNQITLLCLKSDKKPRYINVPILYPLEKDNVLLRESNLRKVVYHGSKVPESFRYQHPSHLGRVDLLEAPESMSMGIVYFMACDAKYSPEKLEILPASSNNPQKFLSLSSRSVPFMHHSDSVRAMMGGKNLKQALKVVKSEPPFVKAGVENDLNIDFGVNALVGYLLYHGLNFEDGIVVSQSFAEKMTVKRDEELKIEDYVFLGYPYTIDFKNNSIVITDENNKMKIVYKFFKKNGDRVCPKDKLVERTMIIQTNEKLISEKTTYLYDIPYPGTLKSDLTKALSVIYQAYPPEKSTELKKDRKSKLQIKLLLEVERPLEVGDKLTGRHGNKGVVSRIIPDEKMPYTYINGEKRPLDIILSPFGIITRMNLGQLLETQGSMVGINEGKAFEKVDSDKLKNYKKHRVILENGKETEAVVGFQYFVRLDHCVRDKLHVISKTRISDITFQPYKGKKNDGGQRIGEMEFWTLFDHNSKNLIGLFSRTNLKNWKEYEKYIDKFREIFQYETSKNKKAYSISIDIKNKKIKTRVKITKGLYNKLNNIRLLSKDSFVRKYMLGRRIHYSGRAVIVPATDIDIEHVYLPIDFAVAFGIIKPSKKELRELLIGNQGIRKKLSHRATEISKQKEIMVLLNRQPSLHLHNIQSFYPLFWEHHTIGLPIMLCEGFAADFDGDTMAVYYPVSQDDPKVKAELESMLPSNNLFKAGNGELLLSIGQDIAFGNYKKSGKDKNKTTEELINLILNTPKNEIATKLLNWQHDMLKWATEENLSISFEEAAKSSGDITYVKESKARGKDVNFKQMAEEIEINGKNIKTSFGKGVEPSIYLGINSDDFKTSLAVRGRKSMLDKKLHVAQAGYFTRKLVEFLYPLRIDKKDCSTDEGIKFSKSDLELLKKSEIPLERLILGRYIKLSKEDDWILITYENIDKLKNIEELILRSPVTCKNGNGAVCSKCCGVKLTNFREYNTGDFIGVLSGHSIGEFGTQFSMKTFQFGDIEWNLDKVSKEFFKSAKNYKEYLKTLAEKGLLKEIKVASIYLEILFYYLKFNEVSSESKAKKLMKDINKRGLFSAISFEMGQKELLRKLEDSLETEERSPKAFYALSKDFEKIM